MSLFLPNKFVVVEYVLYLYVYSVFTSGDTVNAAAACLARYSLCQQRQSSIKSLSCNNGLGDSSPLFSSFLEATWKDLKKNISLFNQSINDISYRINRN